MRTEIWRDCRNVRNGWRCVTEYGEELFIQYPGPLRGAIQDRTGAGAGAWSRLPCHSQRRADRGHHRAAPSASREWL